VSRRTMNQLRASFILLAAYLAYATYAFAGSEKVLFAFPSENTGNRTPQGDLVFDTSGNLYGGAGAGLTQGGVVYQLSETGGVWNENIIVPSMFEFIGPSAGLIFGPNGSLFGTTTAAGGPPIPDGLVFELTLSEGTWVPTPVYDFPNFDDGQWPDSLVADASGNLFGTAYYGGVVKSLSICGNSGFVSGCGTVFELSPKAGGGWKFTMLHKFEGNADGGNPAGGHLIFGPEGNLYGAAQVGGTSSCSCGEVFQISSTGSFTILHSFHGSDGAGPNNGMVFDSKGNLYGSAGGGASKDGVIFRLDPKSDGSWVEQVLYQFSGIDGQGPNGDMVFDAAGNLYGTTFSGGAYGRGAVFELTRQSSGQWTETVLYSFTGGADGATPTGSVIFDSNGNLYGVGSGGGNGYGIIYEITP
jgi:uncharacterized repeat protein (TIGR03803 family)